MGKNLAFWGDCNGYGYKIIRILEELGGINVSNYGATEVTSLYYINEKNNITGVYNGNLDKEKYVIMTYHDFITKYPFQVYDIVYATDNHEEGKIVEIVWDETKGRMRYLVDFENTTSWVSVDDIFCYEAKDNSDCGIAIKPMKVKSSAVKLVDNKVVDNLEEGKTMNKKLAIKGHSTRGNEVIELLEMIGGNNIHNFSGDDSYAYYVVGGCQNEIRAGEYIFGDEDMYFFTLEEFLEKYPFKVGDKVVYTKFGDNCDDYPETIESMKWTGTTIEYTFNDCVTCLAKDLKMWNGEPDEVISGIYLNSYDYADEVELNLGDYEIEVRDGKTYAVKKKSVYPKTYEECKKMLGEDVYHGFTVYMTLQNLILCRNVYWKIAGEQMGLDKPWEPNWADAREVKYSIEPVYGSIDYTSIERRENRILVFPTDEMRTEFYYNFKDLIESCKELL